MGFRLISFLFIYYYLAHQVLIVFLFALYSAVFDSYIHMYLFCQYLTVFYYLHFYGAGSRKYRISTNVNSHHHMMTDDSVSVSNESEYMSKT
jgi:hypothetical protein